MEDELLPIGTPVLIKRGPKGVQFRIGRIVDHIGTIGYKVKYKTIVYVVGKDDVETKTNKELYNEFYRNKGR